MSTVDTEKMESIRKKISTSASKLEKNIEKLVEATKKAEAAKNKAREYNEKELTGERKTTTEGSDLQNGTRHQYKYTAHVNNSKDGMASSGMRSITGAPKDFALMHISDISNIVDNKIPESIEDIKKKKESVEEAIEDPNGYKSGGDGGYSGGGGGGGHSSGGSGISGSSAQNNRLKSKIDGKLMSKIGKANENVSSKLVNKSDLNNPNSNNYTPGFNNNSNNSNNTNQTNDNNTLNNDSNNNNNLFGNNNNTTTPSATMPQGSTSHTYYGDSSNSNNNSSSTNGGLFGIGSSMSSTDNDEDSLATSIINGIDRIKPTKITGKVQQGSAAIPIASGLSAAAAAGLGGKMLLDKSEGSISFFGADKDDDDDDEKDEENENNNMKKKNILEEKSTGKEWLKDLGIETANDIEKLDEE